MNKAFEKILERLILESSSCEVYKLINPNKENIAEFNTYKKCIEIVKEVAEEYNGGWIACSDRLPEEYIEVLVSVKEIDGSFYTRTSWMQDGVWVIKKTPFQPEVIAWQPLPEPYKERD